MQQRKVKFVDSLLGLLNGKRKQIFERLVGFFAKFLEQQGELGEKVEVKGWKMVVNRCPQQENHYDCGVFT